MDRTTTHHNQDTTVPSQQNPPSRIPQPRGVTVRPWPWRPEFFQNHSRPGGQRRPLLLPHPPHPPLLASHSDLPSPHSSPAATLQPLLVPPSKHLWSPQATSKAMRTWCVGRTGRQPGGHPQTWLHPHLGPGGPSDTSPCRRHIQTTQGLHPERPRWKHFSSHIRKRNQAKTAPVAQAPRPQGNGMHSASTSAPWEGGRASPPGLF